jgi:hypothetical protein
MYVLKPVPFGATHYRKPHGVAFVRDSMRGFPVEDFQCFIIGWLGEIVP